MDEPLLKTGQNVQAALRQELQTASLYRLYARAAKAEGYLQIADYFMQTADNELEHAGLLLELSNRCVPPCTADNLRDAVQSERQTPYEAFAKQAQADDLPETAHLFRSLQAVEDNHARRFRLLLENIQSGTVFQKSAPQYWVCRICGALHHGMSAPLVCAVCGFSQACFSLYTEDY